MPVPLDFAAIAGEWVSVTGLAGGLSWLRADPQGEDLIVSARGHGETGPATWASPARTPSPRGRNPLRAMPLSPTSTAGTCIPRSRPIRSWDFWWSTGFTGPRTVPGRLATSPASSLSQTTGQPPGPATPGPENRIRRAGRSSTTRLRLPASWHCLAPAGSRQIVTLQCSVADGQLQARAGEVEAIAHVYSDAHHLDDPPAFLTTFEHDHMRVHVQARVNRGVLVVCEYTEFTDGSGRRDYFIRECYQR